MNDTALSLPDEIKSLTLQESTQELAAKSEAARVAKELEAKVALAKRFPRHVDGARAEMVAMCDRPSFCLKQDGTFRALYNYPRGGKPIMGPSVYLSRAMAQAWGNMHIIDCEVLGEFMNPEGKLMRRIRAITWDLEKNVFHAQEDTFEKLIQRKDKETGETRWIQPDERDLRELTFRRAAILERNTTLKLIPADIVDECVERIKLTAEIHTKKHREEMLPKIVAAFARVIFGLDKKAAPSKEQIKDTERKVSDHLGHGIKDITLVEINELRETYAAIEAGQSWLEALQPKAEASREKPKAEAEVNTDDFEAEAPTPDQKHQDPPKKAENPISADEVKFLRDGLGAAGKDDTWFKKLFACIPEDLDKAKYKDACDAVQTAVAEAEEQGS